MAAFDFSGKTDQWHDGISTGRTSLLNTLVFPVMADRTNSEGSGFNGTRWEFLSRSETIFTLKCQGRITVSKQTCEEQPTVEAHSPSSHARRTFTRRCRACWSYVNVNVNVNSHPCSIRQTVLVLAIQAPSLSQINTPVKRNKLVALGAPILYSGSVDVK